MVYPQLTWQPIGGGTLPTAFHLGQALAAMWHGLTGWIDAVFGAGKALAAPLPARSQTITAPPAGQAWKNYIFMGSARIAVRIYANGSITGEVRFLLSDHLGSLSAVTDASGTLLEQIRYTAFGEIRPGFSGSAATDYEYTGQLSEMDSVGLLFYRARFTTPSQPTSPPRIQSCPGREIRWRGIDMRMVCGTQ